MHGICLVKTWSNFGVRVRNEYLKLSYSQSTLESGAYKVTTSTLHYTTSTSTSTSTQQSFS